MGKLDLEAEQLKKNNENSPMVLIDFQPVGRRGECSADQTIFDSAHQLGVELTSICGGIGSCHTCKIQVLAGTFSETTSAEEEAFFPEELEEGYRLACQTYPLSDCKIRVPPESLTAPQRTQIEGLDIPFEVNPAVAGYSLTLSPPSLEDLEADSGRVLRALKQQHGVDVKSIDYQVLRTISPNLRAWDWQTVASVYKDEVIALGPGSVHRLGLAVDLGTTKIAGYLLDLDTGRTLAAQGMMNPQIAYGEDVIARIAKTTSPTEGGKLQELAVEALNQLAGRLCAEAGVQPEEVVDAVIVANTAIHHLFLGLPAEQLALAPFVPAVQEAVDIKARDIGLRIAPGVYVHTLPNIAGFVGADHVAMLLATGVGEAQGVTLALDIGTNTEVCLISGGEMISTSTPSGPAFEGAHIKHGMRAADGAIERVRLHEGRIEYQTIGGAPPVGLCGSGILDTMAQLYLNGILNRWGRMKTHPRTRVNRGETEFVLVSEAERGGLPAITMMQGDVRELQLAKGAIRTGIDALLKRKGLTADQIDQVIIAGAFGTYINVASAMAIGMLPRLPLEKVRQVGNAAGMGAKLALIDKSKRAEAHALGSRVGYIELSIDPEFESHFVQATLLG